MDMEEAGAESGAAPILSPGSDPNRGQGLNAGPGGRGEP